MHAIRTIDEPMSEKHEMTAEEMNRLAHVANGRLSFWTGILFALVGLLAFVIIFNLVFPTLGDYLNQWNLILLGLVFSLIPAALWLSFFYHVVDGGSIPTCAARPFRD